MSETAMVMPVGKKMKFSLQHIMVGIISVLFALSLVPALGWADEGATDAKEITASVAIVGPDAGGEDVLWASRTEFTVPVDTTADVLTEMAFDGADLAYVSSHSENGWYLESINSPFDDKTYAYCESSGKYWQFFVNETASDKGASSVVLQDGDSIIWYYSAYGDAVEGLSLEWDVEAANAHDSVAAEGEDGADTSEEVASQEENVVVPTVVGVGALVLLILLICKRFLFNKVD